MKDIFNTNKSHDKNEASIIRVIRPGSDDYDKVHYTEKSTVDNDITSDCNKFIMKLVSDDVYIDEFIKTYTNIINTNILSGKKVSNKAYDIYNLFRSI